MRIQPSWHGQTACAATSISGKMRQSGLGTIPLQSVAVPAFLRLRLDADSRAAWRVAVTTYLASRAVLILVGWLTLAFIAHHSTAARGAPVSLGAMQSLLCRWDCGWYMSIAAHGYTIHEAGAPAYASSMAFWPALPYLARYLHIISGMSILASGVLLVNIAFLLSLYYLYKYCRVLDFDGRIAAFAVALLAFAPQNVLFAVFYGDALSLLGVIGAMYHARSSRWWVAGLFAILASSSRPTGIMVLAFLVVYAYQTLGWKRFLKPWINARPFIPVVLAPAGHFLVMWMAYFASGDAFAEAHTRAAATGWGVRFAWPWQGLVGDFRLWLDLKFWASAVLLLSLSTIPLVKRRWWPDAVFAICYFLLIFSQYNPEGLLHYAILLPTIYIGFAWMLRDSEYGRLALLGVFASVGAVLCCAWALHANIAV